MTEHARRSDRATDTSPNAAVARPGVATSRPARVPVAENAPAVTDLDSLARRVCAGPLGGGEALPPDLREPAETALATPLDRVRLHHGAAPDALMRRLGAEGAQIGNHVVVRSDRFAPGTPKGRDLIGHELVHAAQFARAGPGSRPLSRPGDPSESEARRLSPAVLDHATAPLRPRARPAAHINLYGGPDDGEICDPDAIESTIPPVPAPGPDVDIGTEDEGGAAVCEMDQGDLDEAVSQYGAETDTSQAGYSDPSRQVCGDDFPEASFDPEAVDVDGMGNSLLNTESIRVDSWIEGRAYMSPRDPDLSAFRRLQSRLKAERNKRIREGHLWLTTATAQLPSSLYMIMNYNGRKSIVLVDSEIAAGRPETSPPGPIMTSRQFHDHMSSMGIEVVSEDEYNRRQLWGDETPIPFGTTGDEAPWISSGSDTARQSAFGSTVMLSGSGAQASPFSRRARSDMSLNPEANFFHGNMAEHSLETSGRSGFGLFLDSTNAQGWTDFRTPANTVHTPTQQDYPVFDFQRVSGSRGVQILGVQRISVKSSVAEKQTSRMQFYRQGLQEMLGVMPDRTNLDAYLLNMPEQSGLTVGSPAHSELRATALADSRIAVNSDDVADFRRQLAGADSRWGTKFTAYRRIYSAMLRDNPIAVEVDGADIRLSSVADVDAAGLSPQQLADVQAEVGRRAAGLVVSSGITTRQLDNLRAARQGVPSNLSNADVDRMVTSDWVETARHGNNRRGLGASTVRSAGRGAGANTIISVITTAGTMLIDEAEHPDWAGELTEAGGLGALGGAVETGIEHVTVSRGTNFALQRGVSLMSASRLRYLGGGVGATIGAPIIEGISMAALEDRPMQEGEVPTRLVRSAGLGLTSYAVGTGAQVATTGFIAIMLTSGGTGAASGSVVPGWGTAIGLVVGLGVGFATYMALENTVPGGRADYDEQAAARQREAEYRRREQEARARREAAERAHRERLGQKLSELSASTASVEALFGFDIGNPRLNRSEEGVEPTIGELEAAYIDETLREANEP